MRLGKCVLVNDPVGASTYIEHGKTGFLAPPSDPEALRDQIRHLLSQPKLVRRVGEDAQRAAAAFTWPAYFAAVERCVPDPGHEITWSPAAPVG